MLRSNFLKTFIFPNVRFLSIDYEKLHEQIREPTPEIFNKY